MKKLLAALLVLIGCSGSAKPELHLLIWANYLHQDLVTAFEKEFNCRVVIDNFDSGEALRAKIEKPPSGFDVVVPSDEVLPGFIADGLLEKLDMAKLSNYRNIAPAFRGLPFDPTSEYSVPFHWGLTGIAYDAKGPKPESWAAMFEAAGAILDDPREVFAAALRLDGGALSTATADQIEKAKARIAKAKPKAWNSQPQDMMANGDVSIAMIYSGDAAQVMTNRPGVAFVIPKEGGTIWFDNLAIAKGSKQADLAHKFIDYLMRPDVAAANTNFKKYPSPNEAARPKIDKAILENPTIYPPDDVLKRCKPLGDMKPEMRKKLLEAWGEIKGQ